MATFNRLEDIRVWHLARKLTKEIYRISEVGAFGHDGASRIQIRKASSSIVSNISEGHSRDGNREFIHFLSLAKGSAGEVIGQLYMAYDQSYIDESIFRRLRSMARLTIFMIDNLMKYLRNSDLKGKKFVRLT